MSRKGEIKIGQKIQLSEHENWSDYIAKKKPRYTLLGIPESFGVIANHGKSGCETGFFDILSKLLHMQYNQYTVNVSDLLVLGYIDTSEKASDIGLENASKKVTELDEFLWPIIYEISRHGSIPIIIGGGHNNAYPIIKGISRAKGRKISTLNIDNHADLRETNPRHSGNGFSLAWENQLIEAYYIYGLLKPYNNQHIFDLINSNKNSIFVEFIDNILMDNQIITNFISFIKAAHGNNLGIEIDMDSIEHFTASAMTSFGISSRELYQIVLYLTKHFTIDYVHIAEWISTESSSYQAKFIAQLILEFITTPK
jgi:formiminoglutamase